MFQKKYSYMCIWMCHYAEGLWLGKINYSNLSWNNCNLALFFFFPSSNFIFLVFVCLSVLTGWSVTPSVFSFCGTLKVIPHLLKHIPYWTCCAYNPLFFSVPLHGALGRSFSTFHFTLGLCWVPFGKLCKQVQQPEQNWNCCMLCIFNSGDWILPPIHLSFYNCDIQISFYNSFFSKYGSIIDVVQWCFPWAQRQPEILTLRYMKCSSNIFLNLLMSTLLSVFTVSYWLFSHPTNMLILQVHIAFHLCVGARNSPVMDYDEP